MPITPDKQEILETARIRVESLPFDFAIFCRARNGGKYFRPEDVIFVNDVRQNFTLVLAVTKASEQRSRPFSPDAMYRVHMKVEQKVLNNSGHEEVKVSECEVAFNSLYALQQSSVNILAADEVRSTVATYKVFRDEEEIMSGVREFTIQKKPDVIEIGSSEIR